MIYIVEGLLLITWFIVVPLVLGKGMCNVGKLETNNILMQYVMGWIVQFSVFQLLAIPSIFTYQSLTSLIIMYVFVLFFFVAYSLKRCIFKVDNQRKRICEIFHRLPWSMCIAIVLIVFQIIMVTIFYHEDADDAFYVSTATTAIETDTMFVFEGDTGAIYDSFPMRYVCAPFPIYTASISKMTGIHPTIIAHLIFPSIFIILSYVVFYLLGKKLLGKSANQIGVFLIGISMLNLWGNFSVYTASTFLLLRVWQGKAVLANVILPLVVYFLLEIWDNDKEKIYFIGLFLAMVSSTLVSSVGVFLGTLLVGVYMIIFATFKKKFTLIFKLALCCIPNICNGILYIISYV